MRLCTLAATLVVTLFASSQIALAAETPARPDDPQPLIQQALVAYKAGHIQDAIDALQKAIAIMQKSQREGLASFFPKIPDGWSADQIQTQSLSAGGNQNDSGFFYTTISRVYTRKSDQETVTVTLANSPQMIESYAGMMKMFENPQYLAAVNQNEGSRVELINESGWKGWSTIEKGQDAKIIAIDAGYLLTVEASKDDKASIELFWKAIDLKGLAGQSSRKPADK